MGATAAQGSNAGDPEPSGDAEQRGEPLLEALLEDHDQLLGALGDPAVWSRLLDGPLDGGAVEAVALEPVGTGQVASCLRVRLTHAAPAVPTSLVVKTGSSDPAARAVSAALAHPATEVGFYRELAAGSSVDVPTAWLTALRADATDFALVLDDVADGAQGDQIAGMAPSDALRATDELAALHATAWDTTAAQHPAWLGDRGGGPEAHAAILTMLLPGFLTAYGDRLTPRAIAAADAIVSSAVTYLGERPGPHAVVHGDFRPDNLLVSASAVTVVDWQTVTIGPALADLAYFVGTALVPEDRRRHHDELVARYVAALGSHGVHIDAEDVVAGCRRHAFDGLVMAIGASQVVGRTPRGDEMFVTMAERSVAYAFDLGTPELLEWTGGNDT